jgi:hypothetical protein
MSNVTAVKVPKSMVASREVVSTAGAAIRVVKLTLTSEGKASLRSKSYGITSLSDKTISDKKLATS